MKNLTQAQLINLTSEFYSKVADSFSETRQNAWAGWEKVMAAIDLPPHYSLLDVACGNLRFEKFLVEEGVAPERAICVDNCELLLPEDAPTFAQFKNVNLFSNELNYKVDFAVCFGFMHHIPSFETRKSFIGKLKNCLNSEGYLALSFWQFMKDERIARKAKRIDFEQDDYLLGWKDKQDVFRYCHNFSDDEISRLTDGYQVVAEFSEDGKSHNLNKYVILGSHGG